VHTFDGIPVEELEIEEVDWTHRGDYIRTRSARKGHIEFDVEPEWATEAATDPQRLVAIDPASRSGQTIRVVGWSSAADHLLTVIMLPKQQPPDGRWWGVNAWASNRRDEREYQLHASEDG
jgi:hypothetical protein